MIIEKWLKKWSNSKEVQDPKWDPTESGLSIAYSSTNPAHTTKIIEFRDELVKNKIWWEPIQEERTMSPIFY